MENNPCYLNENNIIKEKKISTMEVWLYGIKYNFTLGSFVSLKPTGSLVKHSSTDWKAAWVCEMVGKNKRDTRQDKGICRGIKALHAHCTFQWCSVHNFIVLIEEKLQGLLLRMQGDIHLMFSISCLPLLMHLYGNCH